MNTVAPVEIWFFCRTCDKPFCSSEIRTDCLSCAEIGRGQQFSEFGSE